MILETKSLWLKTTEMSDLQKLHENFWTDVQASKAMLWKPSQRIEDSEKKIKNLLSTKHTIFFTIIKKDDKEPIGLATITKNKQDETIIDNIGFGFGYNYTHKGYGIETLLILVEFCFSKLGATKINVSYLKQIGVSNNLQKMFGFVPSDIGLTQVARKHTGEVLEVENYTLTKEMWDMKKMQMGK